YLQMPRESIRSVVLSAEKDAVKRFLSHVHQSWDQLQVSPKEQEAMETMTAAFIHKFPHVTPELFIDLSQFIPYMSVADIMTFPASLMVNESCPPNSIIMFTRFRLMAISDHSSEMKSPQKQAFVKRLLQSSVAGDVPSWPPYFLSSILPLLPHLPVSHFQQLTSQQVSMSPSGDPVFLFFPISGCHVLRTVFGRGKNLTILICYLNSEDLQQLLSSSNLSPVLWQQLAQCVSEGHVSGSGRVSLDFLDIVHPSAMASLHGMLPQMGASFLEPLSSNELLHLVTLPGGISENGLTGASMDMLGPFLPFLDRDVLAHMDQEQNTNFICTGNLTVPIVCYRDPKTWTVGDVEHVDRLLFTLSPQQIRSLPLVRTIPSCADIKGTFPSAWRSYQLNRMKKGELKMCVEFIGQDDTLDAEQREALWMELRPVKPQLKPEQVLELGCIVTEMGERDLQAVNLSNLAVVAHLGDLNGWNAKKMRAVVLGIMKQLKQKPEELGVMELVSFGHLLCGFSSSEISCLDPFNLSVAALFLGEMVLPCSEQQTEALTSRLSNPLGFGPVSSWGSEVFTEIGTLAAGLEDMVLSALIKEQVDGLTPAAITLIPPRKFAVVFSATQLSWLSSEQACAVTEEQWAELDSEQRQALGMAQYEGELMLEHRVVWIIVMFLSAVWTLMLTAPIHCRGSTGEQVM
uniref:Stereocilin n=1 Tax=Sinocyclocheilus anshuiensis TaxID=1608454 RepID=A0A671KS68_9TELE